jgi:hypothetical protein
MSLGLAALACGGGGSDVADSTVRPSVLRLTDPSVELPAKFSEVGLYTSATLPPAFLDAPRPALPYQPGYPLWSDGGEKYRAIVLPDGASIDASDRENYAFPVGTVIFKTFAYRTPTSPHDALPVETRLLRLRDDGWELAAYSWADDASDAELLDLKRAETRAVLSSDGQVVAHAIPSRLECRWCHESSASEVLGVNELQLVKSGSLIKLGSAIHPQPSAPYAALPEHGPLTTSVLGYFVGNCVHCHNGSNGAASSFDLRPDVALANLIDQPTASSATADGIRVAPGKPDESILFLGVQGGSALEVKDMPPVGVALRDSGAVQLLNDWISALADAEDP